MRKILRKIDRRFQLSRPGSVLILVVALLVLMALIGTAFLSTARVDRYAVVQQTNNAETDLLLEGVKNMARATIVGSLNDPSLPFSYRPANSTIAKNWDAYDLNHRYTDDPLITTTPNDAWLSPRTPSDILIGAPGSAPPLVMWPCIGEPLTGNVFESPIVLPTVAAGTTPAGAALPVSGAGAASVQGAPLTYHSRTSRYFSTPLLSEMGNLPPAGDLLTPTFATINYLDGTSATYPAFSLTTTVNGNQTTLVYLAGDADGDGIADSGLFKLPMGPVNGLTYYAAVRIIDNESAVNVNSAERRYDFNGQGVPTRYLSGTTPTYSGTYNLGIFQSNIGLAELLTTYDGSAADNGAGTLGSEFSAWLYYRLNGQTPPGGVISTAGQAPAGTPIADDGTPRADFAYSTIGDLITSQIGRRPTNPGMIGGTSGTTPVVCQAATDSDEAALTYHFVFDNPNAARTSLEISLHNSLTDDAPNGITGPPTRQWTNLYGALPTVGSTSYVGTSDATKNANVVAGWYTDNFDFLDDYGASGTLNAVAESCMFSVNSTLPSTPNSVATNAGQYFHPRRSILTANSAVSNLTPQPDLSAFLTSAQTTSGATRPVNITNGAGTLVTGMSPITSTLCKASINTATFPDLWRGFWLSMIGDDGISPLGMNSAFVTGAGYTVPTPSVNGTATPMTDHDLVTGQSIYTGSQFQNPPPMDASNQATLNNQNQTSTAFSTPITYPQHPQEMFRSVLRTPANTTAANVYVGGAGYSYIDADQMVLLRSAIAAANATAMRYPVKGSSAPVFAYDLPLIATVAGVPNTPVYARVYGVTQQPYITEVYANTNTQPSQEPPPYQGQSNPAPYVAIELFNPYNTDINLAGWQLATVDRSPASEGNTTNRRALTVLHTFTSADIVPHYVGTANATSTNVYQGGYAILENYGAGAPTVYRPASTNLPATGPLQSTPSTVPVSDIVVPNLANVIVNAQAPTATQYSGQELVLLRPITGAAPGANVAEATVDQVPVDSFDFTGLNWNLPPDAANGAIADVWHYFRGNAIATTTTNGTTTVNSNALWRFIYPGRYDASDPTPYASTASGQTIPTPSTTAGTRNVTPNPPYQANTTTSAYQTFSRRQQGAQAGRYYPASTGQNPAIKQDPFVNSTVMLGEVTLGQSGNTSITSPNDNAACSYPVSFPFQYLNNDSPGAWPLAASPAVNTAPFGQFARNSDLLSIPFVGAYMIFTQAPTNYQASNAGSTVAASLSASDMANVLEINSLPIDCSFAEDTDITDDPPQLDETLTAQPPASGLQYIWNESVGHFAPVNTGAEVTPPPPDNGSDYRHLTANASQTIADSDPTLTYQNAGDPYAAYKVQYNSPTATVGPDSATQRYWRYHWASRVFDYLTAQAPSDDYFPNVQQSLYTAATGAASPVPVQNSISVSPAASVTPSNPNTEDTVPVYGLININTAPWRVLSTARFCPFDDAEPASDQFAINTFTGTVTPGANGAANPDGVPDNTEIAQAVANWRDFGPNGASNISTQVTGVGTANYPYGLYKGPFTSLSDLLNVPVIYNYMEKLNFQEASAEPNAVHGHFSPYGFYAANQNPAITDGVRNDTDERYDLLHRISNQCTVKSDVYTVYIEVQGWQNAGSTNSSNPPKLITQKRAAFIIDRSNCTPTNSTPKIINVPTN